MSLDSKSIPVFAAVFVLLAAGGFLVGRMLMEPSPESVPEPRPTTTITDSDLPPALAAGQQALQAGRLDEARELLQQVGEADPAYLLALSSLGALEIQAGQGEAAAEAFDRLLQFESNNPAAHFGKSRALFLLDSYTDAEYSCLRTLELATNHAPARYHLALIRIAQDRVDLGIDSYLRAMEVEKLEEQLLGALNDLNVLHAARPELPAVHYALAFFASTFGSREQELEELNHFLALEATGPVADQARAQLAELSR